MFLAFFAVSSQAFVAPATPALSRTVVTSAPAVSMFSGGGKSAPKKAVKKPVKKVVKKPVAKKPVKKVVKKVVKKPVKKVVKKAVGKKDFRPGQQMPANQAVTEVIGGFLNAFNLLKNLPK